MSAIRSSTCVCLTGVLGAPRLEIRPAYYRKPSAGSRAIELMASVFIP
jgi:hypothetical protein